MGNTQSINKINFEDMKNAITNNCIIINTLNENKQECLIYNTVMLQNEEIIINNCIKQNLHEKIIIYGENSQDDKIISKYYQLYKLGFTNIYVYVGGLFEWLLLQDIYGKDLFQTTSEDLDILKYKGSCLL